MRILKSLCTTQHSTQLGTALISLPLIYHENRPPFSFAKLKCLSESVLKLTLSSIARLERRFFWICKVQEIFSLWAKVIVKLSLFQLSLLWKSSWSLWMHLIFGCCIEKQGKKPGKRLQRELQSMCTDWTSETAVPATNWTVSDSVSTWTGGLSRLLLGIFFGTASMPGAIQERVDSLDIDARINDWCFHTKKAKHLRYWQQLLLFDDLTGHPRDALLAGWEIGFTKTSAS